jgi:hypothetical protein
LPTLKQNHDLGLDSHPDSSRTLELLEFVQFNLTAVPILHLLGFFWKCTPNWSTSMKDIVIFDQVEKQLRRLPKYVVAKLKGWATLVETEGLRKANKHAY